MLHKNPSRSWSRRSRNLTYDDVKEIASQATSRSEFRRLDESAYLLALKNKWLDEFFPYFSASTLDVTKPHSKRTTFSRQVDSDLELIRELYRVLQERNIPIKALADRAGIHANTVGRWKRKNLNPGLREVEYAIQALGLKIVLVPQDQPSSSQKETQYHGN